MNQLKYLQSMSTDEIAEFLDQYGLVDNTPWWKWWNSKYCDKCESVKATIQGFNRECEFAWCELEHKCRFFTEMNDIPDSKEIIKMWLKTEVE